MKSLSTLTAIALTLGLGILPAAAQTTPAPEQPKGAPGPRHLDMEARFEARLHLTDAQKASFREIRAKHQEALAAKRKAAFEAGKTLAKALANPESKPEELKTLHRSAADLAFEARLEQRAMRLEIRAILTPEQREEGARMEGRMEGMMMSRGAGHWHEGGMGGGMKGCPPAQAK